MSQFAEKLKHHPGIRTGRLLLRPVTLDDVDDVFLIRTFREAYKWSLSGEWTDRKQAIDWVTMILDDPARYSFAIELLHPFEPDPNASGKLPRRVIGTLGSPGENEIGYMFHPQFWRNGYATEAIAGLLKTYFETFPDAEFMEAKTDAENVASRRLLEKCGFVVVGEEVFENPTLGLRDSTVYRFTVER